MHTLYKSASMSQLLHILCFLLFAFNVNAIGFGSLTWLFSAGQDAKTTVSPVPFPVTENPNERTIFWFRKSLRLHDNPAFLKAIEGSTHVWPIFILDPWFVKNARVGVNRWRFLLESLQDLDRSLKKLNSRLYVARGNPNQVFPELFQQWKATRLAFEIDTEPYAKRRDTAIMKLAKSYGVSVITDVSHTLYDIDDVIRHAGGNVPKTYNDFLSVIKELGTPAHPAEPVRANLYTNDEYDSAFNVPTFMELNIDDAVLKNVIHRGGEKEALRRLNKIIARKDWICNFRSNGTTPTTILSPYLKFGCLSARLFYHKVNEVYKECQVRRQNIPTSLNGQLLKREFLYTIGAVSPNFDKSIENPLCKTSEDRHNAEQFRAWAKGKTGYPYIDAVMNQLRTEGWIHYKARQAVGYFLTKGGLRMNWELGKQIFEKYLLDADWSLNAGNWMAVSGCTRFFNEVIDYDPTTVGIKNDKSGEYIRKYIPALRKFPAEYIYRPWTAPLPVQNKAKCIIGVDYPYPIIGMDDIKLNIQLNENNHDFAIDRNENNV